MTRTNTELAIVQDDSAAEINATFMEASAYLGRSLECYRQCGEMLNAKKKVMKHGEWIPWMEKNLAFNRNWANKLMRIARNWEEIPNDSSANHLAVEKAIELMSPESSPEKKPGRKSTLSDDQKEDIKQLMFEGKTIAETKSILSLSMGRVAIGALRKTMIDEVLEMWLDIDMKIEAEASGNPLFWCIGNFHVLKGIAKHEGTDPYEKAVALSGKKKNDIRNAMRIVGTGSEALAAAAESGRLTLNMAADLAAKPESEQIAAIDALSREDESKTVEDVREFIHRISQAKFEYQRQHREGLIESIRNLAINPEDVNLLSEELHQLGIFRDFIEEAINYLKEKLECSKKTAGQHHSSEAREFPSSTLIPLKSSHCIRNGRSPILVGEKLSTTMP